MRYHCVITGQRPHPGGGSHLGTMARPVDIPPGTTRSEAFMQAAEALHAAQGWPAGSASIIFFALEPDTLA